MAEFQLIQERNISGKGILRVPSDIVKRRLVVLYASVLRPPLSPYLNLSYSPPRGRYANLTFFRNKHVIGVTPMEFDMQSWDVVTDITSQNLIAIKCAYEGMLQSLNNFAIALSLIPVSVVDLIQDYEYLDLAWDEVRVVCVNDTAVNLRLYTLPHDTCDADKDRPRKPPPPPPPPPRQPPGTPLINLDRPYEEDDDVTDLYPGDEATPPPLTLPGEACVAYRMIIRGISDQAFGEPTPGYRDFTLEGWGEFSEPYLDTVNGALRVDFRGGLSGDCLEGQVTETVFVYAGYSDFGFEIVSFEEI